MRRPSHHWGRKLEWVCFIYIYIYLNTYNYIYTHVNLVQFHDVDLLKNIDETKEHMSRISCKMSKENHQLPKKKVLLKVPHFQRFSSSQNSFAAISHFWATRMLLVRTWTLLDILHERPVASSAICVAKIAGLSTNSPSFVLLSWIERSCATCIR